MMSVQDLIQQAARNPDATLTDNAGTVCWREFAESVHELAAQLEQRYPKKHSRIGIRGCNSLDYLRTFFALLAAGKTAVPLNTRLTPEEFKRIAEHVGLSAVIEIDQPEKSFEYSDTDFSSADADQPSVVISSSGSEGGIKAVELEPRSMIEHARAVVDHLSVTGDDHWLACLPFFHVGGLTIPIRCAVAGASLTILDNSEPAEINRCIEESCVTLISMVATTLTRLLDYREDRPFPETLRAIIVGGGPVPKPLRERCPIACATYGLTESGSMLICARPGCSDSERFSSGSLLPNTKLRIVDETGRECSVNETGSIIARGPGLAIRCLNDEKKTALTFREGWLYTDDLGFIDSAGFPHVVARRRDLILSGGENIYPAEIESVLSEHPKIIEAVALPLDDPQWGQIPAALIVPASGAELNEEQVREFLRSRLAGYKIPKRFVFRNELPKTASGKPDLAAIRDVLES